jgi:hypothetical protein
MEEKTYEQDTEKLYHRVPLSTRWLVENNLLVSALKVFWPDAVVESTDRSGVTFTLQGVSEMLEWDETFFFTLRQLSTLGFI